MTHRSGLALLRWWLARKDLPREHRYDVKRLEPERIKRMKASQQRGNRRKHAEARWLGPPKK
jgi:hypothetical protein